MNKVLKCNRSYKVKIEANFSKLEEVRYNARNYSLYLQHFVTQLYFSDKKHLPTCGMGNLANQAQKTAMGILAAHRTASRETNSKSNIPQIKYLSTPALISAAKKTKFDYWLKVSSQWKNNTIKIPAKSHSSLNKAIKNGWKLSERCEIVQEKNGSWYCRVYVTRKRPAVTVHNKTIGIDVGLKHGVSRSDNYLGKNLRPVIRHQKKKQASRQQQKIKNKASKLTQTKTAVKQFLDREVNLVIRRSLKLGLNISIEDPKALANLKSGKLQGWARCYFANRLQIRAMEEGIFVATVWPKNTSITCSKCGEIDKASRKGITFKCVKCHHAMHADINSAYNLAVKGQDFANKVYNKFNTKSAAKTPGK